MTARVSDINGWYEIQKNPISKVGVFPYLGKNIKGPNVPEDLEPGRIYNVYRPAEELSDPECMESFRLLPWIDNHTMLGDPEEVAPGLTPPEEKGVGGVIGENIVFEDDTLYANLKLFSSAHAANVDNGKRELSAGYRCIYEYAPGVWNGQNFDFIQRKIRGNHLASVDEGRMGPEVAVMDAAVFSFTMDSTELVKMADNENKDNGGAGSNATVADLIAQFKAVAPLFAQMQELIAAAGGAGAPAATPAAGADDDNVTPAAGAEDDEDPPAALVTEDEEEKAAEAMDAAVAKALAPLRKSLDAKGVAAMDGAIAGLGKKLYAAGAKKRAVAGVAAMDAAIAKAMAPFAKQMKAMQAGAPTAEAISAGIARRDNLAKQLSQHVGVFDHSAMSEAQVAAYGVEKLKLPNVAKGQEVTAVTAALAVLPVAQARVSVAAMDGADTSKGNMFIDKLGE